MLHRREFVLGSAGLIALGGCATARADAPDMDAARAMLLQATGRRESIAGMVAVAVGEDGARMASHGSSSVPGLAMDGDTVFEIGSITKMLAALLLADMAERGELGLDDRVADHLPVTPGVNGRPITLRDLAAYRSGLPGMPDNMPPDWFRDPNPLAGYPPEALYEFLAAHTPQTAPGAQYEYSNLAFGALGLALARRAGKSFDALLRERLCKPLGLEHTGIALTPDMQAHVVQGYTLDVEPSPLWDMPALQGAGAARSSANDLTVFLEACMGLGPAPWRTALARTLETRTPTPLAGTEAALGWFVSSEANEEIVWKTGVTGGCNSFIGYSTRRRRGAIVLANFLSRPEGGGPVDGTTLNIGMAMINPDFHPGDIGLLY